MLTSWLRNTYIVNGKLESKIRLAINVSTTQANREVDRETQEKVEKKETLNISISLSLGDIIWNMSNCNRDIISISTQFFLCNE